jgi:hypothetical protein
MRNKCEANHVLYREYIYYCVRRVPYDLIAHYGVKMLGLELQNVNTPAIQLGRSNDNLRDNTIKLSEACELYLRLKGVGKDKVFIRTANRNTVCVTKLRGDRPMLPGTTQALPKHAVILKWTSLGLTLVRFASALAIGSTF